MDPGHVLAGVAGGDDHRDDLVERHPRRVKDLRLRLGQRHDLGGDQRAGIEHHGTGRDQLRARTVISLGSPGPAPMM